MGVHRPRDRRKTGVKNGEHRQRRRTTKEGMEPRFPSFHPQADTENPTRLGKASTLRNRRRLGGTRRGRGSMAGRSKRNNGPSVNEKQRSRKKRTQEEGNSIRGWLKKPFAGKKVKEKGGKKNLGP